MVTMEGLLMEVVSIVIQHPSNPLDPMMDGMFQFGPLSFIQKRLNAIEKIR
jgi:hypothetical protein